MLVCSLGTGAGLASGAKKEKSKATACQLAQLKHRPAVDAFVKKFVAPGFNAGVVYQQIRKSGSSELAIMKYRALSPDQRRAVWDNKLSAIIHDEQTFSDYTSAQQAYIVKVKNLLPSLDFSGAQTRESVQPFIDEARSLFSKSQAREIFSSLSTSETAIPAKAAVLQNCNCNITDSGPGTGGGWDCWAGQSCGLTDCEGSYGCGWMYIFYCGGRCFWDK